MSEDVVVKDVDYYLGHQDEFDALSEGERNQLLIHGQLATPQGDTEATATAETTKDTAETPDSATGDQAQAEVKPAAEADDKGQSQATDEPVVLARDGKNIIPFSELQKSRDAAAHWEQVAKDQQKLLDDLKAAQEADADTGKTDAQDEVLAKLKEDFPELAEMLGPVIQSMIDARVGQRVDALIKELDTTKQALAPLQETAEQTAEAKHYAAIREAHTDFDAIVESGKLDEWIAKQPSFTRDAYNGVLEKGTATQVIELFQAYKDANGIKPPEADAGDGAAAAAAAAKDAAAKTKAEPPLSLSDIPAGGKAHHDEAAALAEKSGFGVLQSLMNKPLDQIHATLAKIV
jgi:hypothetical protein